jgi:hypothetical protein
MRVPKVRTHMFPNQRVCTKTMNTFATLIVAAITVAVSTSAQQNPICYVCFDEGLSTITRPSTSVPLPAILGLGDEINCGQIRLMAEDLLLLPPVACQFLDSRAFRVACGCQNAWTSAPVAPVAAPVATKAPSISNVKVVDQKMGKKTSAPSNVPSTSPSSAPVPIPAKGTKKAPNMQTKKDPLVPDSTESEYPSTVPSDFPSSSPSAASVIESEALVQRIFDALDDVGDAEAIVKILLEALRIVNELLDSASTGEDTFSSLVPSDTPSTVLSSVPSNVQSIVPSTVPSETLSEVPSTTPSDVPSSFPSNAPSGMPSSVPSDVPSTNPSSVPSDTPSDAPSDFRSAIPSDGSSDVSSDLPSIEPNDNVAGENSDSLTFWERVKLGIKNIIGN